MTELNIEVACATGPAPEQQVVIRLRVPAGTTVEEAIRRSGVLARTPQLDLTRSAVGVFGRRVALGDVVHDGDRVEIYRGLIADPREARRRLAQSGPKDSKRKG